MATNTQKVVESSQEKPQQLTFKSLSDLFSPPETISRLVLRELQLKKVPEEIFMYKDLKYLDLSHNFIAALPPEMAGLKKLEVLILTGNNIHTLPPALKELKYLRIIDLAYNQFTAFPVEQGHFPFLEELRLKGNQLTSLAFGGPVLAKLKILDLAFNALSGFSFSPGAFSSLEVLHLEHNSFTECPENLISLKKLIKLDLSLNALSNLPEAEEWKIQELYLRGNSFRDFPEAVFHYSHLGTLDLSENFFSLFPEKMDELSNLEYLYLDQLNLSEIPRGIFTIPGLKGLSLRNNNLLSLKDSIGTLEVLDLGHNHFILFPEKLYSFYHLKSLNMEYNKIESFPGNLEKLSFLEQLNLNSNPLEGEVMNTGTLKELHLAGASVSNIEEIKKKCPDLEIYLTESKSVAHDVDRLPPSLLAESDRDLGALCLILIEERLSQLNMGTGIEDYLIYEKSRTLKGQKEIILFRFNFLEFLNIKIEGR